MTPYIRTTAVLASFLLSVTAIAEDGIWTRHTIDGSSRGADGIRMNDVNGDGLLDIATGWEEGGVIRVYLNPGPDKSKQPWPATTVGMVKSAEDAVFADLDDDGNVDVVSSCEGRTRTMFFHWAPAHRNRYLESDAWKTQAVPCTKNKQSWMFALPLDVDGLNGVDLIVGSKGGGATIGWLESPADPRDMAGWKFHKLRDAGWIMSLIAFDMDGDGDRDVVASDRKGPRRGAIWLENPGTAAARRGVGWKEHSIGAANREVMFLDVLRPKDAGGLHVMAAVKPASVQWFAQEGDGLIGMDEPNPTESNPRFVYVSDIQPQSDRTGTAKSVRAVDVDLDGFLDLVYSCEQAQGKKSGLIWMKGNGLKQPGNATWKLRDISGPTGVKFDLLQLVDLDADGDQDVLCCEERANLGVIWYENPTR